MFEIVNDDARTDAGACVYYKLTHEPLAQVSQIISSFFSYFRLNILQYPYVPFCSFSLVVKCRTSKLRVLGSSPDRGTHFPLFLSISCHFQ